MDYYIERTVPELIGKVTIEEFFNEILKSHLRKGTGEPVAPIHPVEIKLTNKELIKFYNIVRKNKLHNEAIVQIQKHWNQFEEIGFNLQYVSLYDINRIIETVLSHLTQAKRRKNLEDTKYQSWDFGASEKIRENLNKTDENNYKNLWMEKIADWNKDKMFWSQFENNPDIYDFVDCNMEELWDEAINDTLNFYKENYFTMGSCME